MLEKTIENLSSHNKLLVKGCTKSIASVVKYCTYEEPTSYYFKIMTDDHYVLVVSLNENYAYYGTIIPKVTASFLKKKYITYKGNKFTKTNSGYQVVDRIILGDSRIIEGEVSFVDFSCEKLAQIISAAIVSRTGKRADVLAEIIDINDLDIQ